MINRVNKLAALLITATTIASLAPAAITANAAARLTTKEGTIENAIAFDNGNYIYDGYMTDDDESGLYFHNTKDSFLEDDEDYEFGENYIKYGTKYAVIEEDGDEYLLDLSTGKILDDETIEDIQDSLESKLKTTFNKVDRYEKLTNPVSLTREFENQFGEVWYSYTVKGTDTVTIPGSTTVKEEATAANVVVTIKAASFGQELIIAGETFNDSAYTQQTLVQAINDRFAAEGNLNKDKFTVSAKENGTDIEVTVTSATKDKVEQTYFGNFSIKAENGDVLVFTAAKEAVTETTLDKKTAIDCYGFVNENGKYIDTSVLANITVVNGTKTTKVSEYNDTKDGVTLKLTGINAIAQDSKNIYALANVEVSIKGEDNTVTTTPKVYLQRISKAQGNKEDDAYLPSKVESFEISGNYCLDGDSDDFSAAAELLKGDKEYRVVKDTLYVTDASTSNVEVSTIKLKKEKVTVKNAGSTKYDLYLAQLDEQDDQDMQDAEGYSIDAEGNTWVLNKGKIYKFDGKDFDEVYSCDRSMDRLDVYNSENLIVWEEDEDVFAVIGGTSADKEESDKVEEDTTVKTGWVKNADGTWAYIDASGNKKTGWLNDNGTWYYLNALGSMQTGWLNDRGTWYYLQPSGAMKTGWLNDNGTWYYLNVSGAMQTGWLKDSDGRWYFLQSSGAMAVNTTIQGYVLGANGAWVR